MKVLLTPLTMDDEPGDDGGDSSLLSRFRPARIRAVNNAIMPAYAVLLLCEGAVLDESSFARLQDGHDADYGRAAPVLERLHAAGLLELRDCQSVLDARRPVLGRMLEHDLKILSQWVWILRESLMTWRESIQRFRVLTHEQPDGAHAAVTPAIHEAANWASVVASLAHEALQSAAAGDTSDAHDALRRVLRSCLSCANAGILLADELGIGLHDWADTRPFYRQKFLSMARERTGEQKSVQGPERLCEISFPERGITDTDIFLRAMEDSRVAEVRKLVEDAVEGRAAFDREFAEGVLREVLGDEERGPRHRRIALYQTMPLSMSRFLDRDALEAVDEGRLRTERRWLYLLSDVAEAPRKRR